MSGAALAAAALMVAVGGFRQPVPSPEPRPTPPPPVATEAPATPIPVPTPVLTPSIPPATPTPAPTPVYHFVYTPPPAASPSPGPRILEIDISDQTLHPNSDVALRVVTTPEVSTVSALTMGREVAIPQTSPGVFAAQSHIPGIPFFLLRTYDVEFKAATADGQVATITLPIHLVR